MSNVRVSAIKRKRDSASHTDERRVYCRPEGDEPFKIWQFLTAPRHRDLGIDKFREK